ncbi:MAG: hypothetical protein MHMPM18_001020 [Marteilia pararefringens]
MGERRRIRIDIDQKPKRSPEINTRLREAEVQKRGIVSAKRRTSKVRSNIDVLDKLQRMKSDNASELMEILKKDNSVRERSDILNIASCFERLQITVADWLPMSLKDQLYKLLVGATLAPDTEIKTDGTDLYMIILYGDVKVRINEKKSIIVNANTIIHTHEGIFGQYFENIHSVKIIGRSNALLGVLSKEDTESFALAINKYKAKQSVRFSGAIRNSALLVKEANTKITDLDEPSLIENLLWVETEINFCIEFLLSYNLFITDINLMFEKISNWVKMCEQCGDKKKSLITLFFAWMYINPGDFNRYPRQLKSTLKLFIQILFASGNLQSDRIFAQILEAMLQSVTSRSQLHRVILTEPKDIKVIILESNSEPNLNIGLSSIELHQDDTLEEICAKKRVFIVGMNDMSETKIHGARIMQEIIAINHIHPAHLPNRLIRSYIESANKDKRTIIHTRNRIRYFSTIMNQKIHSKALEYENCQHLVKNLRDLYALIDSNVFKKQDDSPNETNAFFDDSASEFDHGNDYYFHRHFFRIFELRFGSLVLLEDDVINTRDLKRLLNQFSEDFHYEQLKNSKMVSYDHNGKDIKAQYMNEEDFYKPLKSIWKKNFYRNCYTNPIGLQYDQESRIDDVKQNMVHSAHLKNITLDVNGCLPIYCLSIKYLAAELTMLRSEQFRNSNISELLIDDVGVKNNALSQEYITFKSIVDSEIAWIQYLFSIEKSSSKQTKLCKILMKLLKYLLKLGNLCSFMSIVMALKHLSKVDTELFGRFKQSHKQLKAYFELLNPKDNYGKYHHELKKFDDRPVVPFYVVHSAEVKRASGLINDAYNKDNNTVNLSKIYFVYDLIKCLIQKQQYEYNYRNIILKLMRVEQSTMRQLKDVQNYLTRSNEVIKTQAIEIWKAQKYVTEQIDIKSNFYKKNNYSLDSDQNSKNTQSYWSVTQSEMSEKIISTIKIRKKIP